MQPVPPAVNGDPGAEGLAALDAAWLGLDFDAEASAETARRGLDLAVERGDRLAEAAALCVLSWLSASRHREIERSNRQGRRALRLLHAASGASEPGPRAWLPRAHSALAMVMNALGDRAGRFEHLEAMRKASVEAGDTYHEVLALHDLGLGYDRPELIERALELAQTLARPGLCVVTNLLHSVMPRLRAGDAATALQRAQRAWALVQQVVAVAPVWQVETLRILAVAQAHARQRRASLRTLAELQVHPAAAPALVALARARVHAALGERGRAAAAYQACLDAAERPRLELDAARELAQLLAAGGRWRQAWECQQRIEALRLRLQQEDNERRLAGLEVQHRQALQEQQVQQEQARNRELAGYVARLEQLNREVTELSVRDALTGLYNRRHADAELARALTRVQRGGDTLAVALLDIDHFKQVNDLHGHAVGDAVLLQVARVVGAALRGADLLARYGGEEFLLLLPGARPESAAAVCERIGAMVEGHDWSALAPRLRITVSQGLAQAAAGATAAEVLRAADRALYAAKRAGRNRVVAAPAEAVDAPGGANRTTGGRA